MNTNLTALNKLADLLSVSPERDCWNKELFTGTIKAMGGRMELRVGTDFVCVTECADNGKGYFNSQRSTVVPKGLSYAQIAEWVNTWIDNKPAMPDGTYRISGRDSIYSGPALTEEQKTYLMSYAHVNLSAYPLGGSIQFVDGKRGEVWGSI